MSDHKFGERRMNNGREMEVIPYAGAVQNTYEAIKALREAEGMPADAVCAHCDRHEHQSYYLDLAAACDCGPEGLWVPVEWVPILKMIDNSTT